LSFDSKVYSTDELLVEVMKDQQFFDVSGGGITVSGGDPVYQHEFVEEFLAKCKVNGLQTTIESSLYTSEHVVKKFMATVDKFIIDMKLFDSELHERYTGKPNEIIKKNISFLIEAKADVLIRIPLIPNYTANEENIKQITRFIRSLSLTVPIEVLNFNNLPRNKYEMLGLNFPFTNDTKPFSEKEMEYYINLTKRTNNE
jgi:pyruvate formate lyase activating enzyme